jgi:hypothetical protein
VNWADLGKTLLGLGLPTIGGLLGGPGGAAVGKVIADQIGVPATPEAVKNAISADPEVLKKMQDTEAEWARTEAERFKAAASQSQAINATMQAETAAGVSWYHFRHLNGYVPFLFGISMVVAFNGSLFLGLPSIADFKTAMEVAWAPFAAFCGLVGYVAMDTSRRTQAATTGTPITGVLDIVGSLFKRK